MRPEFHIRHTPGEISVADVSILRRSPTCIVLDVNCDSKYPSIAFTGDALGLCADSHTLRPDSTRRGQTTTLEPVGLPDGWSIWAAEAGRYSVIVLLMKAPREAVPVKMKQARAAHRVRKATP